jgi:hypothetical protein
MAHKKGKKVIKKKAVLQKPTLEQLCPVQPLQQINVEQFKLVAQLSDICAAVIKDISEKEQVIIQMGVLAKKLSKGEIKGPLMQQIMPGVFAPYHDLKDAAKKVLKQRDSVQLTVDIARGQLPHRHTEYVDALILFRNKINETIGDAKSSDIAMQRVGVNPKEEKVIFERSFEDFQKKEQKSSKSKK